MRLAWMFLLLGSSGWAQQNMEITWMVGGNAGSSSTVGESASILSGSSLTVVNTVTTTGTAGFVTQIGFAYQLPKPQSGWLWLEVPMTFTWQGIGSIYDGTGIISSVDRNTWYLTPGLRAKTPTYGRVSFYGVLGGGLGAFVKDETVIGGPGVVSLLRVGLRPVADVAGGIDLRLSRRFSLKVEGRDFVSGANLGGVSGHNHPMGLIGLGVHF
jgi:hypothetical protein